MLIRRARCEVAVMFFDIHFESLEGFVEAHLAHLAEDKPIREAA